MVSTIKINEKILKEYNYVHQYNQQYIFEDGSILNQKEIKNYDTFILDIRTQTWNKVKKWQQYIFNQYVNRSSSLIGKNIGKGNKNPPNKGMTNIEFFGKERAKEISEKLSIAGQNRIVKDETKQKLKAAHSGKPKIRTEEGKKSYSEKRKGKSIHTEESRKKISEKSKQNYINDPTLKERTSHKGEKNGRYGKPVTQKQIEKTKNTIIEKCKNPEYAARRKQNAINRSILSLTNQNKRKPQTEIAVENWLKENNIEFENQYVFKYVVYDFYIKNTNYLIEVQGDYWHANPLIYDHNNLLEHQKGKIIRDKQKKTYAENRGYKVLTIWENDIKQNNFKDIECLQNIN